MPLNKDVKKILVIGSGPIVIGQAAEFDYAGTQACRALKEDGIEVVLVNSNPATIMTDRAMADKIYIEPLTLTTVKRIIEKERPDSILSTLGGQVGLTLSMQLAKEGFLDKYNVKLLGAKVETIDRAEDRQRFKDTLSEIGQPVIPSTVVTDVLSALDYSEEIGFPLIIRPAFTLGGNGGGVAHDRAELKEIVENGLRVSPIHQVLVEKSVAGWKEIEFELMRDSRGNIITICSMENVDPVGVHTGDSIVVAPAVTLSDKEYQMLRSAAINIIEALKIEGGCNCQFALNPDSFEYAVIEVNPRVSRSSALASKATGYPIAKVATKIAVGYNLDEIKNAVTGQTFACFEPAIDYIVVKFPRWPFDKFIYANRTLGTQMKATGEVMAIAPSFEQAIMKAVRGAEISRDTLNDRHLASLDESKIIIRLAESTDERIFVIFEALKRGIGIDFIYRTTKIDKWFLAKLDRLVKFEARLRSEKLTEALYLEAKKLGYLDKSIKTLSAQPLPARVNAVYKMVDTCAAEFSAETPYFYSTYDTQNEAEEFLKERNSGKKRIIVFGSGPIRIGQGIEFDYASVHCVRSLRKLGYEVVIVNNNPETVSTDFDTADRLYFEPLTPEDVMNVIATEKPYGVVVAFGGQTAIKLTKVLSESGIKILGTSADSIDAAEDRERFDALLEKSGIKRPLGHTAMSKEEAVAIAAGIGYPILLRPSYVLGGQNMVVAYNRGEVEEYMDIILEQSIENPVLIDKYLMGTELEVDAICDGEDILIPGIMEHIERTGVHSGDSIAVYPSRNIDEAMSRYIVECSKKLAVALETKGLVNIQYLIYKGELYVIEVNPRASRTIPYISKVVGVPMVDLATRCMLGERLKDLGYGTGLYRIPPYFAVKVPVFSFEKLSNVDTQLGPEMKSTGEVLGVAATLSEAIYKGMTAAGYKMKKSGGVFVSVRDADKSEISDVVKKLAGIGFKVYATQGTATALAKSGISVAEIVYRINDSEKNALNLLESGKVNIVISTSSKGRIPTRDSVRIRRKAVERDVPCLTSIDTANAFVDSIMSRYSLLNTELVDINHMRESRKKIRFTKMEACGNDYVYFDCDGQKIDNPEGLAVRLSERRRGIGSDGIVLMFPSSGADVKMRIFNADGIEGLTGGNSLMCVAKYVYDRRGGSQTVTIETNSGVKTAEVFKYNGEVKRVRVAMGRPSFVPSSIPLAMEGERVIDTEVAIGDNKYRINCLSMGNPHCVIFTDEYVETLDLGKLGAEIEKSTLLPERINVEFVSVADGALVTRVWERGGGEVYSCGTGACAAAVAAVANGLMPEGVKIPVKLKGGDLYVEYADGEVFLNGDVEKTFDGEIEA